MPVARRAAASTSVKPRWYLTSLSGLTWIWNCLTPSPKLVTLATPGTANRRGFTSQRAVVRTSIKERLAEVSPSTITVPVEEDRGVSTGGLASKGSLPGSDTNRSDTNWRAR